MGARFAGPQFRFKIEAEWVTTNDADHQRRGGIAECLRRPLDKFRKIVEKTEFDRVFRTFINLSKSGRTSVQDEPASDEGEKSSQNSARMAANSETAEPSASGTITLMQTKIHQWNLYPTLIRKFRPS